MLLTEYVWSRNPRGLHNAIATLPMDDNAVYGMRLGMVKLTVITTLYIKEIPTYLANNVTPIIRVFEPRVGNAPMSAANMQLYRDYFTAGARWFEYYNEPNLADEWPFGFNVDYRDTVNVIAPLMDNWLTWAEMIAGWGAYPAFPALTESAQEGSAAIPWMDAMLGYLRDQHQDRMRQLATRGLWIAVHAATLNHFYQEVPGRPDTPRPPSQYNGDEGGWHFEYPLDPLSQKLDPGRTVFGGTSTTPLGDPNGLFAMGTAIHQRLREWFGIGILPVISTESGVLPVPLDGPQQPDPRFPAYDRVAHGEATLAMFNAIAAPEPAWMFGLCMWKEDEYLTHPSGQLPAVQRLANTPVRYKDVLPIDTMDATYAAVQSVGPGPVNGEPDLRYLYFAPGFDTNWFFDVGATYWVQFRPSICTNLDLIAAVPYSSSLALTVFVPSDSATILETDLRKRFEHVQLTVITAASAADLAGKLSL